MFNCSTLDNNTPDNFKKGSRPLCLDPRISELTQLLVVRLRVVAKWYWTEKIDIQVIFSFSHGLFHRPNHCPQLPYGKLAGQYSIALTTSPVRSPSLLLEWIFDWQQLSMSWILYFEFTMLKNIKYGRVMNRDRTGLLTTDRCVSFEALRA